MHKTLRVISIQYALPQFLPIWGGKGGVIWGDLEGCSLKTMMFEKYPSISPYTYCANNPMKYVDPTGETIWILGDEGAIEYKPGMKYTGKNEFTTLVVNTLNDVVSKSNTANRMVDELSKSEFNFRIVQSTDNHSGYVSDGAMIQDASSGDEFYEKSGGEIQWKTNGQGTYEENSKSICGNSILVVRSNMNLFHELAHGWDNMASVLAGKKMEYDNLKIREWTATRTENLIRKEMLLPLRTHYGIYESSDGTFSPMLPLLLNNGGKHRYEKYQH